MILHNTCQEAINECLENETFSIARLRSEEKTFNIHVHPCHELYFSIEGGRQFLIESNNYPVEPGDVFFVKEFSSHCVTQVEECKHDRIVVNVHPDYLKKLSTPETDLTACFENKRNRLHLNKDDRHAFMFFIQKLSTISGYGADLQEQAAFLEFFIFLNRQFICCCESEEDARRDFHFDPKATEILNYINDNLLEDLTLDRIAKNFYISKSYLCRIFSQSTGTTINKYISARRISIAKSLLTAGESVMAACKKSGFNDYSNFHKTFTRTLGITPKKYQSLSMKREPFS